GYVRVGEVEPGAELVQVVPAVVTRVFDADLHGGVLGGGRLQVRREFAAGADADDHVEDEHHGHRADPDGERSKIKRCHRDAFTEARGEFSGHGDADLFLEPHLAVHLPHCRGEETAADGADVDAGAG